MEDAPRGPWLGPVGIRDTLRRAFFVNTKAFLSMYPVFQRGQGGRPSRARARPPGNTRYLEKRTFSKGTSISQGIPYSREAREDARPPRARARAPGNTGYIEKGIVSRMGKHFPRYPVFQGGIGDPPPSPEGQGSGPWEYRKPCELYCFKGNTILKVSRIPGRPWRTPPKGQGSGPWEYGIP